MTVFGVPRINVGGVAQVELAKALATYAHTGQYDKNDHDYIDHPKAVFYRVYADDETDYEGQVVAWLHDVVEDQADRVSLAVLSDLFPDHIVEAVIAITFRVYNKDETREQYYERVKADPIALRVKLHDIAHNTSPKRMDKLPQADKIRLRLKYKKALGALQS